MFHRGSSRVRVSLPAWLHRVLWLSLLLAQFASCPPQTPSTTAYRAATCCCVACVRNCVFAVGASLTSSRGAPPTSLTLSSSRVRGGRSRASLFYFGVAQLELAPKLLAVENARVELAAVIDTKHRGLVELINAREKGACPCACAFARVLLCAFGCGGASSASVLLLAFLVP